MHEQFQSLYRDLTGKDPSESFVRLFDRAKNLADRSDSIFTGAHMGLLIALHEEFSKETVPAQEEQPVPATVQEQPVPAPAASECADFPNGSRVVVTWYRRERGGTVLGFDGPTAKLRVRLDEDDADFRDVDLDRVKAPNG